MNPDAAPGEVCPFTFNFDPLTFKVGDMVSYRVPSLGDFPFVGTITAVHDDYIELVHAGEQGDAVRASRAARPVVQE